MARTMFAMGFTQSPFYVGGLGDSSFDALTPDKKKETLENELDPGFALHGKTLDVINKAYGGLGDKLKAYLGADYDTFVTMYYGMMALSDKVGKISDTLSSDDPAVLGTLSSSDEQTVAQWISTVKKLQGMLQKNSSAPAPVATTGGPSTGTLALVGAGLLG